LFGISGGCRRLAFDNPARVGDTVISLVETTVLSGEEAELEVVEPIGFELRSSLSASI
jgi:hypothetical protein